MRARTHTQKAIRRHKFGCQFCHPLIGAQPGFERLLVGGKGGRITNHHVKPRPLFAKGRQNVKGITLAGFKPVLHAHLRRALRRQCQRRFRAVDRKRMFGTCRKRRKGKAADMREHVEHPRALGKPGGEGVVGALIKKQAGFLPAGQIGHIDRAIHGHCNRGLGRLADQNGMLFVQPFKNARAPRGVFQNGGDTGDLDKRRHQIRQHNFGPGGIGLDDRDIAEPVDHDPRKAIGLGMDQPVMRRVVNPLAHRMGARQSHAQPLLIDPRGGVTIQHAGHDLGGRAKGDKAKRLSIAILKHGDGAWGQGARAPVGHKLVVKNPRGAMADCAGVNFGKEADNGIRGHCHTVPLRGFVSVGKGKRSELVQSTKQTVRLGMVAIRLFELLADHF